jgi:hypothetical protein
VFYSFHRTYTKSFIIFGSVHDFLFKFKHQAFLNKKKKKKTHCGTRPARSALAQDGPRAETRPLSPL